eukprot:TRINITY_DN4655_c0_g1_i4.p3 TRINITY_DN4655_c0_g1~~TRINITY_DN4655_c0_g1_i4.p3  ORF type:complete len:294 (-),score=40.89 TRINITY_DN4655_c0_g1_i4:60-941(-)
MCLSKATQKTIIGAVAILLLFGGAYIIYFGVQVKTNHLLGSLPNTSMLQIVIYSVGSLLAIQGFLQLYACVKQGKCAICLYEILAFVLFALFGGAFIFIYFYHADLDKKIREAPTQNHPFANMYEDITNHSKEIYDKLCPKALYVMECEPSDLNKIFNSGIPQALWVTLAGIMERYGECSGLVENETLPYYYFSNKTYDGIPPNVSCTKVLDEMCDELQSEMGVKFLIALVISGVLFLNVLAGLCLCCEEKRRRHKHHREDEDSLVDSHHGRRTPGQNKLNTLSIQDLSLIHI